MFATSPPKSISMLSTSALSITVTAPIRNAAQMASVVVRGARDDSQVLRWPHSALCPAMDRVARMRSETELSDAKSVVWYWSGKISADCGGGERGVCVRAGGAARKRGGGGRGRDVFEGGGGSGTQKIVCQQWPDHILPMVNFVF